MKRGLELFFINKLLLEGLSQFIQVEDADFAVGVDDYVGEKIQGYDGIFLGALLIFDYIAVPVHETGVSTIKLADLITAF